MIFAHKQIGRLRWEVGKPSAAIWEPQPAVSGFKALPQEQPTMLTHLLQNKLNNNHWRLRPPSSKLWHVSPSPTQHFHLAFITHVQHGCFHQVLHFRVTSYHWAFFRPKWSDHSWFVTYECNCIRSLKMHLWYPSDSPGPEMNEIRIALPSDFTAWCLSSKNICNMFWKHAPLTKINHPPNKKKTWLKNTTDKDREGEGKLGRVWADAGCKLFSTPLFCVSKDALNWFLLSTSL